MINQKPVLTESIWNSKEIWLTGFTVKWFIENNRILLKLQSLLLFSMIMLFAQTLEKVFDYNEFLFVYKAPKWEEMNSWTLNELL